MSRYDCAPSNVIAEYLALGKPVVAYDLVASAVAALGLVLGHIRARVTTASATLETLGTGLFRYQPEGWCLLMFHNTEISGYGT